VGWRDALRRVRAPGGTRSVASVPLEGRASSRPGVRTPYALMMATTERGPPCEIATLHLGARPSILPEGWTRQVPAGGRNPTNHDTNNPPRNWLRPSTEMDRFIAHPPGHSTITLDGPHAAWLARPAGNCLPT
jgi:hypothetical protein